MSGIDRGTTHLRRVISEIRWIWYSAKTLEYAMAVLGRQL